MERRSLAVSLCCILTLCIFLLVPTLGLSAETATIGGGVWKGAKLSDGSPQVTGNTPIRDAKVMVQNVSGGAVVAYGEVEGNSWTATVEPGEYIVMVSAPGYDATSREFTVKAGDNQRKDAYLPPLPFPKANLLVYAFIDNYVNGEDDFPTDPGLKGVTFKVIDEDGNVVATGVSGLSPTLPDGAGPDTDGLYYFTGLPSGEYNVCADPSTVPAYTPDKGSEWYLTTSEEGGHCWEAVLYPGDPGTENGVYLNWFGFVPKLGQLPAGSGGGSISGTLLDADGGWGPGASPNPFVSPNVHVPDGLLVLYSFSETIPPEPVATVEADPATGNYTFENVPPGRYKIFASDIPIDYIWGQMQVNMSPDSITGLDIYIPRFYARIQGYVEDASTGEVIPNAKVCLRLKDGSIWKEETSGPDGWYNFDKLSEVEVLGFVDVELPTGFHGSLDPSGFDQMTRTVQWFSFNYRADLRVEPVPAETGDIGGFVFVDSLERGSWNADGSYNADEERTYQGATVELYDGTGALVATAKTGKADNAALVAQGWIEPYTWPPDDFGGVFYGQVPGYYEFRDLAPGTYTIRAQMPSNYSPSPTGSDIRTITVGGGSRVSEDFGITTLVPLAGEIEGGIFDDVNLDENPSSLLFGEKAGIAGVPVGVYDHLGYFLGHGYMGNPLCYSGSTVCPEGETAVQKPEIERRFAPGIHLYLANDPTLTGYNPNYEPLTLPYEFGQGKYKFEADWSLIPTAFLGQLAAGNIIPVNTPVVINVAQVAPVALNQAAMLALNSDDLSGYARLASAKVSVANGTANISITGQNFGGKEGYSTVTLGGVKLKTVYWSENRVTAQVPRDAVGGPLIVATSTGISNSIPVEITYDRKRTPNISSFFVNGSFAGTSDGSKDRPWKTIGDALKRLPSRKTSHVFIAPGTYREKIWIKSSNVNLIGSGPYDTVIDGTGLEVGPVVYIGKGGERGGVSNIAISGFTITGGSAGDDKGGGIFGDYGNNNISINNSIISRNAGYYGGGVWLHKSNHNVNIWSNIIAENGGSGGYGGGISVNDEPEYGAAAGEPEHTVDDRYTGLPPGTYNIFNNLIFHNYSQDYGGGICLYEVKDQLNVYGNIVTENKSADHGGGAFFEDSGPVRLYGNVFLRNYAADDGGGISFEDVGDDASVVEVYNNLFVENIADDSGESTARGGALSFDDTFYASVYNNTIAGNVVAGNIDPAGGAIDSERNGHEYVNKAPGFSDPRIYNNIIWGNWRLEYDRPNGTAEGLSYRTGRNYRWTPDNLHVDNPALQDEWESCNNSESFGYVRYNDITGGYSNGTSNMEADPLFVDSLSLNWRVSSGSPVIGYCLAATSPKTDLEALARVPDEALKVELGAYEFRGGQSTVIRIPEGILGAVPVPRPW